MLLKVPKGADLGIKWTRQSLFEDLFNCVFGCSDICEIYWNLPAQLKHNPHRESKRGFFAGALTLFSSGFATAFASASATIAATSARLNPVGFVAGFEFWGKQEMTKEKHKSKK